MRTFKRVCIEDCTISDDDGATLSLHRGKEYITSAAREDGTVTVFSSYWARVPVSLFAVAREFTP